MQLKPILMTVKLTNKPEHFLFFFFTPFISDEEFRERTLSPRGTNSLKTKIWGVEDLSFNIIATVESSSATMTVSYCKSGQCDRAVI